MKKSGLTRHVSHVALAALLSALAGCGQESTTPSVSLLSPVGANDQTPRFSRDGDHVAYWVQSAHGYALTVAGADLGAPVVLDTASMLQGGPPLWSPDGKTLAYSRGFPPRIWVAALSGGAPRRLSTSSGFEIPDSWDPRGDALVFMWPVRTGIATGAISVASGETTSVPTPELPSGAVALPAWSPHRSHIAYEVHDADKSTIWVADSAGSNARQLTTEGFESFGGGPATGPWSPDGSRIVYVSSRTGRGDVWVASVDGDSLRQLTRDVRDDYAPAWSPDGRWIAFLSDRGGQTDIWIVPAAGGQPQRVTDDPAVENDVQWVGRSTRIAFTTGVTQDGLWTRSLTDTLERRITPDTMRIAGDGWDLSPDGRSLVFQVVRGGGISDLDVIPVAGGPPRVLVSNGAINSAPEWSPDGSHVVYVSDKSGTDDVWVVDASGGAPRDLTDWPTREGAPQWSKDGTTVYFTSNRDAELSDLWKVSSAGGEPQRLTHVGTVGMDRVDRASGTVFVNVIGGTEGQVVLDELAADGGLHPVWDQTTAGIRGRPFSPSGDSVAVTVTSEGGALATMLLPTHGGPGRRLEGVVNAVDWTRDGGKLLYMAGAANDLYVMNVRDGSVQRLTDTPADEGWIAFFLPGDTSVAFQRQTVQRRIAVADVGKLMAGTGSRP